MEGIAARQFPFSLTKNHSAKTEWSFHSNQGGFDNTV